MDWFFNLGARKFHGLVSLGEEDTWLLRRQIFTFWGAVRLTYSAHRLPAKLRNIIWTLF